jgi:hypothetical protein
LERRLAGFLEEATGNLGRINESRQVMFGRSHAREAWLRLFYFTPTEKTNP